MPQQSKQDMVQTLRRKESNRAMRRDSCQHSKLSIIAFTLLLDVIKIGGGEWGGSFRSYFLQSFSWPLIRKCRIRICFNTQDHMLNEYTSFLVLFTGTNFLGFLYLLYLSHCTCRPKHSNLSITANRWILLLCEQTIRRCSRIHLVIWANKSIFAWCRLPCNNFQVFRWFLRILTF